MSSRPRLPFRLISVLSRIIPRRFRADWKEEWEAELQYREIRGRRDVLRRSTISIWDALAMQPRRLEEELFQDLRFGIRMMFKSKVLTAAAVVSLALGIGANTAVFSVINGILLSPLPYNEQDRLVRLWDSNQSLNLPRFSVSALNLRSWKERNRVFENLGAYREDSFNVGRGEELERIDGARVTADLLPTLGVRPYRGRWFEADEDRPGGAAVAVISDGLWRRRFGSDPAILGREIRINGTAHTIVGVMPAGFQVPIEGADLWIPYALDPAQDGASHFLRVIGRLNEGSTLEQARADMESVALGLERDYPQTNQGWRVAIDTLPNSITGDIEPTLVTLFAIVGLVLVVACANVANLLLARSIARRQEIAIRTSLGASRMRLFRQFVTESLAIAITGGVAGVLLAIGGIDLLRAVAPGNVPRLSEVSVDLRVLVFALGASILTALLFSVFPAIRSLRSEPSHSLREGTRILGRRGERRLSQSLVVLEFAGALVVVVASALMLRTMWNLYRVDPGFDPANRLTLEINISETQYAPAARPAYLKQIIERIEQVPGVLRAGATHRLPLRGNSGFRVEIEGRNAAPDGGLISVNYRAVTTGYFDSMGVSIVRGRTFTDAESWQSGGAVVINETLAKRHYPGEDPVGHRIRWGQQVFSIVGVAKDVKESGLDSDVQQALYVPYASWPVPAVTIVAETAVNPVSLAASIREEIRRLDPDQAVSSFGTLDQVIVASVGRPRFAAILLGVFAAITLVLSSAGIYGVMAHAVGQRTHEIGVRVALGAAKRDILRLVLGQGLKLTSIGVIAGTFGAAGVAS
ncbi:MAG: ABC transporter permease, partial [Acidobacteria bacterium]|nr:ABC transporter permease [Acidobacteriota bacterium]